MKILITGSKGMLGQYCERVFSDLNAVIGYDKDSFDITKEDDVNSVIYLKKPDIVVNCAAFNAVDLIEQDDDYFKQAMEINCLAVKNLAKATNKLDIPLVHFSTDYIFDGNKKEGYKEYDIPQKVINKYAETKLCGEKELEKNTKNYYLIRTARLFGSMGKGLSVKRSFVDVMLELAKEKDMFEVVDDEVACPTYALDLAFHTEFIFKNMPKGIYHVTNYGECTWFGFAREIFRLANLNVNLKAVDSHRYPRPAARPRYSILLNTKLPPLRSWQDALRDYIQHSQI